MLSLHQEKPKISQAKPIKASEVQQKQMVSPGKFWTITFQVGPGHSEGSAFPSGQWKAREGALPGEEKVFDPVYLVYDQIVDSDHANGLIESSNDWHKSNIRQKVEGVINRMVAVLDVKEAKEYIPSNVTFLHGGMPMQVLQMIVDSAVEARLKSK